MSSSTVAESACTVWRKSSNFLHTVHIVSRSRCLYPCLPQQQDTIPYAVKFSVLRSWRWAKDCPKHVELILEINKLLLLHLFGFYITLPSLKMRGQTHIKFPVFVFRAFWKDAFISSPLTKSYAKGWHFRLSLGSVRLPT